MCKAWNIVFPLWSLPDAIQLERVSCFILFFNLFIDNHTFALCSFSLFFSSSFLRSSFSFFTSRLTLLRSSSAFLISHCSHGDNDWGLLLSLVAVAVCVGVWVDVLVSLRVLVRVLVRVLLLLLRLLWDFLDDFVWLVPVDDLLELEGLEDLL